MRIDLHVHTSPRSRGSVLDPEEAIRVARARGLDGICFTKHNCLWEAQALKELADRHGFLVLQGVEVDTPGGRSSTRADAIAWRPGGGHYLGGLLPGRA
ncbi:MAG: PHP domain-containing protein [Candidatus Tectomicrobia bacterium]|uniref:PHP domain-containing protein n=1 Tax=Tectimicrobiota bacterium TaxID=2528274 RepID=A0A932FWH0_UNCTE|nr:PHP domain-containing protein [Candidatus Tectomicrobia bacterium]